jgi:DNA-nicking Smr family endonuclease
LTVSFLIRAMARRPLHPDEARLWGRVTATVKPMVGRGRASLPLIPVRAEVLSPSKGEVLPTSFMAVTGKKREGVDRPGPNGGRRQLGANISTANTLDANWDKRLATGQAAPDRTIDLHGHTAAGAHAVLDHALGDAIRSGARVVLLITGRPAQDNPRMPPTRRGVIRASVEDWLNAGPHASRIAAIRKAHPRHGGAGALYLILRKER